MGKGLCQQFNGGVAIILGAMLIVKIASFENRVG